MNKTKNPNCNNSKTTIRERMTGDKVHKDFFFLKNVNLFPLCLHKGPKFGIS